MDIVVCHVLCGHLVLNLLRVLEKQQPRRPRPKQNRKRRKKSRLLGVIQKLRRQMALHLHLIRHPPPILAIVVLVEGAKEALIEDVLIDVADEKKMTAVEDVEVL